MLSTRQSVLLLIIVAAFGCGTRSEAPAPAAPVKPAPAVPIKKPVDQANINELVRKVEALRKRQADLEQLYKRRVLARHPEWTPEKQKQQLDVLRLKWIGSNRTSEEDTVKAMRGFGSQVWDSELVDDDYRDMHRAKSAGWRIDDEVKSLNEQLDRLKGANSNG